MPWEGGETMPIKWNALKVIEAADKVEELVNQAAKTLESARTVFEEAKQIPNLPQYVDQSIFSILMEIERVTGGENSWDHRHYDGSIKRAIDRLRRDIPQDVLKSQQKAREYGSTPSMPVCR
jgi:hypothetical protein